ncbi:MAG: HyaD/HybD family hydrogenase maturation endopeptidase [Gammaproteobacteria bacterium]|nr:HyaD/HybD family hydrogenase maturation endopeptidase [Gammaproteobacteria bacterium]
MQLLPSIQNDPLLQTNCAAPVLVLGLGNILLHDEGVGVCAVQQLVHDYLFPQEVEILDGGTAGMALYEHIIDRTHLIVIDTVKTGNKPGTIVKLEDDEVPAYFHTKVSPHQLALSDILAALQISGARLPALTLIGIEPLVLKTGIGLSDILSLRLEILVQLTVNCLRQLGLAVEPKIMH